MHLAQNLMAFKWSLSPLNTKAAVRGVFLLCSSCSISVSTLGMSQKKKGCYWPWKWQRNETKLNEKDIGHHGYGLQAWIRFSRLRFPSTQKQPLFQREKKVTATLWNPWPWWVVSKHACNPWWQTDGVTSSRPVGVHFKCSLSLCSSSDSIALCIHSQSAQTRRSHWQPMCVYICVCVCVCLWQYNGVVW